LQLLVLSSIWRKLQLKTSGRNRQNKELLAPDHRDGLGSRASGNVARTRSLERLADGGSPWRWWAGPTAGAQVQARLAFGASHGRLPSDPRRSRCSQSDLLGTRRAGGLRLKWRWAGPRCKVRGLRGSRSPGHCAGNTIATHAPGSRHAPCPSAPLRLDLKRIFFPF
jgi:hypothetical protein